MAQEGFMDGTGSVQHAPLSQKQTITMARNLQDHIARNAEEIQDLRRCIRDNAEAIQGLRGAAEITVTGLQSLQEGLAATNTLVEANRKELVRTNSTVQQLGLGVDQNNDGIMLLRDAHKVSNNSLQKLGKDIVLANAVTDKLQEAIDKRIDTDLVHLRDELSRTRLEVKHVTANEESLRVGLLEEREKLREEQARAKGIADNLAETNTVVQILEQRIASEIAGLKATRQLLDELNVATGKLREDYDLTKGFVVDLQTSSKKVIAQLRQEHDNIERNASGLSILQDKFEKQVEALDQTRKNLEKTSTQVHILNDGHDRVTTQIGQIRTELSDVGTTARAVKAGLKEQSAILLPNIQSDSGEVRKAVARHGSYLIQGGLSADGGRGSLALTSPRNGSKKDVIGPLARSLEGGARA
mmetsp:Transcript_88265/g.189471  ORF Transcript_88265/g.189471 Transcript_88265/m.189471 type:complete len:414 (-) Transcript_88265:232-1473(-)